MKHSSALRALLQLAVAFRAQQVAVWTLVDRSENWHFCANGALQELFQLLQLLDEEL